MAEHNDFGKKGEEVASRYLIEKGYTILAQNYRWRGNEVDIIAKTGDIICFVEVKTRTSNSFGEPELFVSKNQQKSYLQVANNYVLSNNINDDVRFDIIAIVHNKNGLQIKHIESAFSSIQ